MNAPNQMRSKAMKRIINDMVGVTSHVFPGRGVVVGVLVLLVFISGNSCKESKDDSMMLAAMALAASGGGGGEETSTSAACGSDLSSTGEKETCTVNGVSFNMVHVEGYSFPTGTTDSGNALISSAYQIAETEVTYKLWSEVHTWAERNGYKFANAGHQGADSNGCSGSAVGTEQHPVTCINWRDAMVWMNALTEYYNAQNGTSLQPVYYSDGDGSYATPHRDSRDETCSDSVDTAAGACDNPDVKADANGFRLPTMDEWELAARYIDDANGDGDIQDSGEYYPGNYASGADDAYDQTASSDYDGDGDSESTDAVAWHSGNSGSSTAVVKSKSANALGLYDMSGNVNEWNFDWAPGFDGSHRVNRGGNWFYTETTSQVGIVINYSPINEYNYLGFRPSRNP